MNNKEKAFTLLEVMVAIFVITVGITGILNLISYNISSAMVSRSQIIAADLTQEGLEVVRAIRDNNWLQGLNPWSAGLIGGAVDCSSGCRVEYNSVGLLSLESNPTIGIDANGFYQYTSGTSTPFKRKITITSISADQIKVVSETTWSERGRSFVVSAEDRLYNWK